ncbi:hypothetical protein GCM10023143_19980 [Compostibacter hankyongensis]|uniref:Porin n=2 Tax=Compostibacter hankyongensis TaxID=1007089 RepID=A0ABP8FU77_9BACT
MISGTGEDLLTSGNAGEARTVISGYGDLSYQRDFNFKTSTLNLNRAVLFVGHQFNNKIAFFSELEVENAKVEGGKLQGEIGMEQAYLKFSLNPRQYLVAGLFLPRIGLLNENHLPINFNGVERPLVEQLVIPATWREIGIGFYGQMSTLPLAYSVAIMNGLKSAEFTHGNGLADGRAEGQMASGNNLALNASLQYFISDWKFQVSGYAGGTVGLSPLQADSLQLPSGMFGAPVYLGEADLQYMKSGFSAKALGTVVSYPDAGSINKAYASNVPKTMYGAYAELGYNLFETAKSDRLKTQQLIVFARYERLNLNARIPANGITDGTEDQSHLIAGLSYLPIPNVVIKADARLMHTGPQNPALIINPNPAAQPYQQNNAFLNLGIGYSF